MTLRPAQAALNESEWLTVFEAATRFGLSRVTLACAARAGNLLAKRSGRVRPTTTADLSAWLKGAHHLLGVVRVDARVPREAIRLVSVRRADRGG